MRKALYLSNDYTMTDSYANALIHGGVKKVTLIPIEEEHHINQSEKAKAMRVKLH